MKLSLKLTHKILLLITVPLIIEMVFFGALAIALKQTEQDLAKESSTVKVLTYVNTLIFDVVSASASFLIYDNLRDQSIKKEFEYSFGSLRKNTAELKELAPKTGHSSREIEAFISIINDITTSMTSMEAQEGSAYGFESMLFTEKLKATLRRLNRTGNRIIESELKSRNASFQKEKQLRNNLLTALKIAALATLVIAIAANLGFGLTIGQKIHKIEKNTEKIAAGENPSESLKGDDDLTRLNNVLYDMSHALKKLREQERAILDNSAEIICSLDNGFRLTEINRAVEKRLGYKAKDLIGTNIQSLIHPEDKDKTFSELSKCKDSADEVAFETRMKGKDGKFLHFEWVVQSPEKERIFCVIHDITERKEAERLKQEVLAIISHDLRTPLTSVRMVLEMFQQSVHADLTEKGQKLADAGLESVMSLLGLTNDLLEVEKYEAGGIILDISSEELATLLNSSIEMTNPEAQKKNLKIEKTFDSLSIEVDKERIKRVLVNLIGNAIKFTPEGMRIAVSAKLVSDKAKGDLVRFEVQDEGPGIPQDKIDLVFEKFKQVGTGSEGEKRGSGLGLAICKALVDAHDGKIGVTSNEGNGSTFWFELPVKQQ